MKKKLFRPNGLIMRLSTIVFLFLVGLNPLFAGNLLGQDLKDTELVLSRPSGRVAVTSRHLATIYVNGRHRTYDVTL